MSFFLYEIAARIVAIYVCIYCGRELWYGLVEGKIAHVGDFPDLSKTISYRSATPIRYWIVICLETVALVAGLVVAVFGWWRPNI